MKLKLHTQILGALVLGAATGYFFPDVALKIDIIGNLFIRLLKMIIVPLVFSSILMGVIHLKDTAHIKSLGVKALLTFLATTLIAIVLGLSLTNTIRPGLGTYMTLNFSEKAIEKVPPTINELVLSVIPSNPFQAFSEGHILSIIFFALLLGCALLSLGTRAKGLVDAIDSLDKALMKLTQWVIALSPIGIFSLIGSMIAQTGFEALKPLGLYITTFLVGIAIFSLIILPLLLLLLAHVSPISIIKKTFTALATAFSTASSTATLPITMEALVHKVGAPKRITNFIIPLGTTINMNGTALYQSISTLFMAQVFGIPLDVHHYILIVITTALASIGTAGIPSGGIITLVIIFNTLHIPLEGLALLLAIDRLLDMFRTVTNVWANIVITLIVTKFERETLSNLG